MLAAPIDGDDSATVLDHLIAAEAATGVRPQALVDQPPCPDGCAELWEIFRSLHACRGSGFGPSRIGFIDLDAFQRVTGRVLASWEIAAIVRADNAYLMRKAEEAGST